MHDRYAEPHPAAKWPLSANISDPVRASIVCESPAQLLGAVGWFKNSGPITNSASDESLVLLRAKNKFAFPRTEVCHFSIFDCVT